MSTFVAKFELFWTKVNESPYDLPIEIKAVLEKAMKDSGFETVTTVTINADVAAGTDGKKKKVSGYNLFMKEKMAELKAENVPGKERMGKIGAMWKALSEDLHKNWNAKAKEIVGESTAEAKVKVKASGTAKTKKLSGYNVFMKEKMAELKAENVPSNERMKKIGPMWKALSDAEKKIWNEKASGSASAATEEVEVEVDEDE
jgi:hypothetical protein